VDRELGVVVRGRLPVLPVRSQGCRGAVQPRDLRGAILR